MIKYKYQIIEYAYTSMTSEKVEVCKTIHRTNSKLLYYLMIIIFKLSHTKYEVIYK